MKKTNKINIKNKKHQFSKKNLSNKLPLSIEKQSI